MRIFRPAGAPTWLEQVLASVERLFRDIMPAPFKLWRSPTADLPPAADYTGALAWDETSNLVTWSNGSAWVSPSLSGHTHTVTGDVSGTVSGALTLATVNANVGTFGTTADALTITANAKGLITAIAANPISILNNQISNPAALTRVDDTNVTLTLSANAGTSLLRAVSLTLGWTGALAVGRGGTGLAIASPTALDNITGFSSTGMMARTGAGAYSFRTITAPAAGITLTNGNGVLGNPTLVLANDLAAVEGLATNGIAARTATDTWTTRTITGTANEITATNGDGVSGNPTLSLPSALTFTGKTVTGGTFSAITLSGTTDVTGGQLKFPATQVPSADANTLDDYEEGTFTPILFFGGANTGMTFSTQTGKYTKIGRLVFVEITMQLSAKGSSTGTASLSGLPFTAGSAPNTHGAFRATGMTTVAVPMFQVQPGTTNLSLYDFTGSTCVALNDTDFGATSLFGFGFAYAV